ncbi:NMT1/THI5 like protein [Maioricimonas rarisocia]|uniref:NMT1/THI5 like protein n=1 Tax=Maioricimonas rarisocia TaxID=2528026 RepID=A0A517Z9J5_9PLAN|nr:ABC transporter substrate-binding protein [Maioricimonas rarisocia]QDU39157.1 NMT1/THI5 like protein [Maioricimonas rarisocia]
MRIVTVTGLLTAVIALLLVGCGTGNEPAGPSADAEGNAPIKVRLALNWYPEAEHGGYYAALVNGYYADEGLDVEIIPGGPNSPVIQRVARGDVEFGIENADRVLVGRAQGADIVTVMAPIQTNPQCLMVHAESGIESFEELKDLTLMMSSGAPWAIYLQKQLPLEGCEIVPNPGSVAQFLANKETAQQGYVFSEPYVVREKGGEARPLMIADLGYNPYTSVLIVSSKQIEQNAEVVQKMVRASVRGWKAYLESPEETNRYIHEQNPEMSVDILAFGADQVRPLCITAEVPLDRLGTMTADRWQTMADQLIEVDAIEAGQVTPSEAFTLEFLDPVAEPSTGEASTGTDP